jgi:hypothetical protein
MNRRVYAEGRASLYDCASAQDRIVRDRNVVFDDRIMRDMNVVQEIATASNSGMPQPRSPMHDEQLAKNVIVSDQEVADTGLVPMLSHLAEHYVGRKEVAGTNLDATLKVAVGPDAGTLAHADFRPKYSSGMNNRSWMDAHLGDSGPG